MRQAWDKYSLNELGSIGRGRSRYRPRNSPHLYGGKYPFIQTADVKSAGLFITKYSQTYNKNGLGQSKLWGVGTLCITIAANIADTSILAIPACFPDSIIGFIPDKTKTDVKYIKYYFDVFQKTYQQISQGAAQDNLSAEKLLRLKIPLPSIETQQKIAAILSAYDDLIENNLQRIKLLEEMAQITYEEWFVRMKFPGHEHTPIDSETGLPEGWVQGTVMDISKVNGSSISVKSAPDKIRYIDIASVHTGGYEKPEPMDFSTAPSRARRQVFFGDTIFSTVRPNRKTYSLILENDPRLIASTGFAVLTPKIQNHFAFVYLSIANQSFVDKSVAVAGGAAYPAVNQKDFEKLKVIVSPAELIDTFSTSVNRNFTAIACLRKQNQILKEARDILLPRLMTGMIDIEQIELPETLLARIQMEASA